MLEAKSFRSAAMLNLALALLIGALLLLRTPQVLSSLNADSLYMECLYRDLALDHLPIKDWFVQPAPSFFPDLPLFMLCRGLAGSLGRGYALYSGAFFVLLLGAFYLLARQMPGIRRHAGQKALLAGLFLLVLLGFEQPLHALFLPAFHASILPLGLGLLALDLLLRQKGSAWLWTSLACLVLALACASDASLALIGFPVALVALLQHFFSRPKLKAGPWPYWALGFSCAAGLAFHALVKGGIFPVYQVPRIYFLWNMPKRMGEQVLRTFADMGQIAWQHPLMMLAFLAWLLFQIPWPGHGLRHGKPWQARAHAELILGLSMLLFLLAPFFLCNGMDARYILPCFVFPAFLWVCHPPCRFSRQSWLVWLLILAGLGQALLAARSLPPWRETFQPPVPEKLAWVESVIQRHGLHQGYCNYWDEKPARVYSQGRVRMAALLEWNDSDCLFILKSWISNRAWWVGQPGRPFPIYDFVLTDGMDKSRLRASFGQPASMESWQGHEIWLYNRPQDYMFRNYLRKFVDGANGCSTFIGTPGLPRPGISDVLNPRSMRISSGQEVGIPMNSPVRADILEFWGWQKDSWQLEFWQGQRLLRRLNLNGDGQPAMAVWCAKALPAEAFDRLVLRCTTGEAGLLRNMIFYPDTL
jgi:hypothetical protein